MADGENLPVKVVVLDIEGTVCPISFVKDVLVPYFLKALPTTLSTEWDHPSFEPYRTAFPPEYRTDPSTLTSHIHNLTTHDIKAPYLKSLQGYLWTQGYHSGALRCPLFPDVLPTLQSWAHRTPPIRILIYSSGSIAAQRLLFKHTTSGDLTSLLTDYFDTTTAGSKTDPGSYRRICDIQGVGLRECLFLSDDVREVRAARMAGMRARLVVREGNGPVEEGVRAELGAVMEGLGDVDVGGTGTSTGTVTTAPPASTATTT